MVAKTTDGGKGSMKAPTSSLHQGMSRKGAKWPDASAGTKGGKSVNNDTTRSSTAQTPRSLGPRTA